MSIKTQTEANNDAKDSPLVYFIKDIFSLDTTAIVIFGIFVSVILLCGTPKKCDRIFKENSQKRHLQQIIIEDIKHHKKIKYEDVSNILKHQMVPVETEVGFVCKILYPLTTRGITNDEDVSATLIIKSSLLIYLITKCMSLLLQKIGVSILLDSFIAVCYCWLANWSAKWTTKGRDSLQEALNKKNDLINKYKEFGIAKDADKAELKTENKNLVAKNTALQDNLNIVEKEKNAMTSMFPLEKIDDVTFYLEWREDKDRFPKKYALKVHKIIIRGNRYDFSMQTKNLYEKILNLVDGANSELLIQDIEEISGLRLIQEKNDLAITNCWINDDCYMGCKKYNTTSLLEFKPKDESINCEKFFYVDVDIVSDANSLMAIYNSLYHYTKQ